MKSWTLARTCTGFLLIALMVTIGGCGDDAPETGTVSVTDEDATGQEDAQESDAEVSEDVPVIADVDGGSGHV